MPVRLSQDHFELLPDPIDHARIGTRERRAFRVVGEILIAKLFDRDESQNGVLHAKHRAERGDALDERFETLSDEALQILDKLHEL